jgi:methionyl-tRNA formyltransferase
MKPRILFMGTPDFAVPALQALLDLGYPVAGVVCQPDRPQGRHLKLQAPPVKQLALRYDVPILQPDKVRTPDFAAMVRALAPELVVTAAYGRILPPAILNIPPHGCLNIHASLLPAYRGAAPIQGCLINGEHETGVTFMLMDEGIDTGDMLLQARVPVDDEIDAGRLSEQLARLGAELLPFVIDGWLDGSLKRKPQTSERASIFPRLTRESGFVDWTADSRTIHNLVRGTTPWPGAYTWCGERRLKIHRARVCTDPDIIAAGSGLAPGTVCLCGKEAISVACGSGVLDLLEIQTDSGRRMNCRDCAHNFRLGQKMEALRHDR